MKGIRLTTGCCPVCGEEYIGTWKFDTDQEGSGTAYVHEWATPSPREEYDELGEAVYDGDACYEFDGGSTETDQYPPQPVAESRSVPRLN